MYSAVHSCTKSVDQTGNTGPIPVEEEAGEAGNNMADWSGEIERISDVVLPARGWVDTVHQSSKWSLAAVGSPASVIDTRVKLALKASKVTVVRAEKLNVIPQRFYWRLGGGERGSSFYSEV